MKGCMSNFFWCVKRNEKKDCTVPLIHRTVALKCSKSVSVNTSNTVGQTVTNRTITHYRRPSSRPRRPIDTYPHQNIVTFRNPLSQQ